MSERLGDQTHFLDTQLVAKLERSRQLSGSARGLLARAEETLRMKHLPEFDGWLLREDHYWQMFEPRGLPENTLYNADFIDHENDTYTVAIAADGKLALLEEPYGLTVNWPLWYMMRRKGVLFLNPAKGENMLGEEAERIWAAPVNVDPDLLAEFKDSRSKYIEASECLRDAEAVIERLLPNFESWVFTYDKESYSVDEFAAFPEDKQNLLYSAPFQDRENRTYNAVVSKDGRLTVANEPERSQNS